MSDPDFWDYSAVFETDEWWKMFERLNNSRPAISAKDELADWAIRFLRKDKKWLDQS